uniref:Uncharacterized protein n=1 Tax=Rhizophora mucronata TaxID=61149 RepID=A0A2P2NH36_RHIMU
MHSNFGCRIFETTQ